MTAKYRNFSYTAKREYQNKVFFIVFLVVFTFLSYILITSYLLKTYRLQTDTMFPEISTGDMVLMTPIYSQASAKRGDLVVIDDTLSQNKSFFKSVVNTLTGFFTFQLLRPFDLQSEDAYSSLPFSGAYPETVLKEGEYFVLCDNRIITDDSRLWGAVEGDKKIYGKIILKYWPFKEFKSY